MVDDQRYRAAVERLSAFQNIMILSHDRPDGDALGSMGAMKLALRSAGRGAEAFVYGEVPTRYAWLHAHCQFCRWPEQIAPGFAAGFDAILIVDTCSWSQLEPAAPFLRDSALPRTVIDHHATRDDIASPAGEAFYLVDPAAASASTMVHRLCSVAGWAMDSAVAEAIFTGISTDTGWFRFSNTDGDTLRAAAAAVDAGVRPDRLYSRIYEARSPARPRLMGAVLSTLEYHAQGALAVMLLTQRMFKEAGATPADAEELVNEPLSVSSVVASVLLTESEDGLVRVNFRSKSPEVCGRDIDVATVAGTFGGGGHRRAAGARVPGKIEEARDRVVAAMQTAMAST